MQPLHGPCRKTSPALTRAPLIIPFSVVAIILDELKGAEKLWAQAPYTKTRKNVHINMRPETFITYGIAERVHLQ
jgi:hypothetical protein